MTKRKMLYLSLATLFLSALACQSPIWVEEITNTTETPEEEEGMDYYEIASTCQRTHEGNLAIATGNIWPQSYVDEQGVTQRGLTAALFLFLKDGALPYQSIRVHAGQTITHGTYLIKVVGIVPDNPPYVRVGVGAIENPEVEWAVTMRADGKGPYEIPANTQLIYRDNNLLVGTGDIYPDDFVDEEGNARNDDLAGLWLAVRDGSLPNQHLRVHSGQEVVYGGYTIQVVEVRGDDYRLLHGIAWGDFEYEIIITISKLEETE
jgi:hypothetical protein